MKHQYDWSKLGAGWEVFFRGQVLLCSGRRFAVSELEIHTECPPGSDDEYRELWSQALDQLTKCRVEPKPEPSPKYNWTKLEGTGWREGNGAFITNGKFNYWYTLLGRARLEAFDKFYPDDAVKAFTSAAAAVEQCRIDWKEEVMSTCRDTGLSTVLDIRGTVAVIGEALVVDAFRRMRLNSVKLDIDKLLAISLVIERLKKLGWRES